MLNRVVIQNFKSIGEPGVDLELKPLTFLVGPNGGGKSSIVEAILMAFTPGSVDGRHIQLPWFDMSVPVEWLLHADKQGRRSATQITLHIQAITAAADNYPPASRNVPSSLALRAVYTLNTQESNYSIEPPTARERFATEAGKVFLTQSTRGNVNPGEDVVPLSRIRSPGVRGEFLIPYLTMLSGSNEFASQLNEIVRWAELFGINDLKAGLQRSALRGNRLGADYFDPQLLAQMPLALASSGSRQVLTVIAQVLGCPSGSLVMVEEPEISLHPQAQIDMMELFGEVIRDGKQIIATTHSHYLLMAIGYAVQKKWISRDDVAVYHVEKKAETGTEAKLLKLGKDGYLKDWVPSYNEVERRLMKAWPKVQAEQ